MIRGISYLIICCITVLTFQSCSSDDEGGNGGPSSGDLILEIIEGNWMATSALFTTINASPVLSTEVVTDGGFCDLSVGQIHNFTLVIRNPGEPDPQITTGVFEADGDNILVRFDNDPTTSIQWNFVLSGDVLFIDGPLLYDFESDGTFEEVSANMQFVPN